MRKIWRTRFGIVAVGAGILGALAALGGPPAQASPPPEDTTAVSALGLDSNFEAPGLWVEETREELYRGLVRFEGSASPGATVSLAAGPSALFNTETAPTSLPEPPGDAAASGDFVFSDDVVAGSDGRWYVEVSIDAPGEYRAGAVQMEIGTQGETRRYSPVSETVDFVVGQDSSSEPAVTDLIELKLDDLDQQNVQPGAVTLRGSGEPGAVLFSTAELETGFTEAHAEEESASSSYFEAAKQAIESGDPLPLAAPNAVRVGADGWWEISLDLVEGEYVASVTQVLADVNARRYGMSSSEPVKFSVSDVPPVATTPPATSGSGTPSQSAGPGSTVAPSSGGDLATTGGQPLAFLCVAGVVLAAGLGVAFAARRRGSAKSN